MEPHEPQNKLWIGDIVVYKEDGPWEWRRGKRFRVVNPYSHIGDTKAASVVPLECPREEEDSKSIGLPREHLKLVCRQECK